MRLRCLHPGRTKLLFRGKTNQVKREKPLLKREFSLWHRQIDHMKTVYWWDILGNIHFKNDLQLLMRANHI